MRSYMERQLTMASVPIVRYYDHLRFVYEVESRVRELRGEAESEGNGEPQPQQHATGDAGRDATESGTESRPQRWRIARGPSATAGDTRQRNRHDGSDYVETSLELSDDFS